MATIQKQGNPINIAPFVDLLLILFVIIIVSAKFDNSGEGKKIEKELASLESQSLRLENERLMGISRFQKEEIERLNKELLAVSSRTSQKEDSATVELKKLKDELAKMVKEKDNYKNKYEHVVKKYDNALSQPYRKNDLHININEDGSILLADVISGNSLAKVSDEQFVAILGAMAYTNVYYHYPKNLSENLLKKVLKMIDGG